ncbi:MAG: metallophosphoesterase family protein [Candidatus Wallbacteria bacterium]|nr:metallophosphoesterase family protein [Candidatus Wallbacteria bacterium]
MKVIICSDLHANIEALKAFENMINNFDFREIIVLGDFVGYGANPEEVISVFRIWEKEERLVGKIGGNHDLALFDLHLLNHFFSHSRDALIWADRQLSEESKDWLRKLPESGKLNSSTLFCHGSYRDPYEYIMGGDLALLNFQEFAPEVRTVFFGHTHVPVIYEQDGEGKLVSYWMDKEYSFQLKKGCRYLINPGSIGQPRNRDPRLSFLVYDTDDDVVTYYKREYDIESCRRKILAAGLPEMLADRLAEGRQDRGERLFARMRTCG